MTDPTPLPRRARLRATLATARRRAAVVTSAALLATGAGVVMVSPPAPVAIEAPARVVPHVPVLAAVPISLVGDTVSPAPVAEPVADAPPASDAEVGEALAGGRASYYGRELAGNRTANGERFDPTEFTAAHRTLPFGTRLRVTYPRTGESVVVRINDRGPFHASRVIDVSRAAADAIGLTRRGTGTVEIERLPAKGARG